MGFISKALFLIISITIAGCVTTTTNTPPEATITSNTIDLTEDPDDLWVRIRRGFAVPNIDTELSQKWTDYYSAHPQSILTMTTRASKYLYHVVDELHQRGMPTELALLPFVESAYNPSALSRSQASGLWQFIPSTGRYYNLKQDWWLDERRDPIASTNAALDYLDYLYEFQGDWHLALASYNWGEGAVKRAIAKNEKQDLGTDYLSLTMPDETSNYVPKLQAFKNIISNPKKYGLTLPNIDNVPYFTKVRKNQVIDVEIAASLAEMTVEDFTALNAAHNQAVIIADNSPNLLIPAEKVNAFYKNLSQYKGKLSSWTLHQRQDNERLGDIAKQYKISVDKLKSINGISGNKTDLSVLIVPDLNAENANIETKLETKALSLNKNSKIQSNQTHLIKKGDTLYGLARRYKTTVSEIKKLNNLKGNKLATGKKLQLPSSALNI